MGKVLVDFDAIGFRKKLQELKEDSHKEYLKYHEGSLGDRFTAMSFESMKNAFGIALDLMEQYAIFEKVTK